MRRIAAATLGAVALVGVLASPASADPLPFLPSAAASVQGASVSTPGEWSWSWKSNVQSQNGVLNLANNGNVCASLAGLLAPGAACSNS